MVVKIVLFMGAIMLLISMLYPGSNAGWTTFQTTLKTGPSLPTWNNPIDSIAAYDIIGPVANSTPADPPASVTGCTMANYFLCLQFPIPAGNNKYASINGVGYGNNNVSVRLNSQGSSSNSKVIWVRMEIWCNTTSAGMGNNLVFDFSHVAPGIGPTFQIAGGGVHCPQSPTLQPVFANDTYTQNNSFASSVYNYTNAYLQFNSGVPVNIGGIKLTLAVSWQVACPSGTGFLGLDGIACQIGQFVTAIFYTVLAFFSLIGFGLMFIGALIIFIVQILVTVALGLFISLLYFFALPGAPPLIQGAVDVIFAAMLIIITIFILDRAVGLFGGAVNKT